MKLRRLMFVLLILGSFVLISCSSQVTQYLGYRVAPDIPETEGDIHLTVPCLDTPVTVWLDKYAIPHVRSNDEEALYFALGYMQGRDRRFQMELMKMIGAGRLRELVGEQGNSEVLARMEVFSRMVGLYRTGQQILDSFGPEAMKLVSAYSNGVNAATAMEPRPLEFRLLNYQPEGWQPYDTALILAMLSFGLCKNWEMELGRMELVVNQLKTGSTIERATKIWSFRRAAPPFALGQKPERDPFADRPLIVPEVAEYLQKFKGHEPIDVPEELILSANEANPLNRMLEGRSASNNWAVGGKWTGTGKGAMATDPHMPHMMPSMGYLAHLEYVHPTDGYKVIGGTYAGTPAIAHGTNGFVGWGPTSNWADITDLYIEKPAPGKPDHYLHNGKAVKFVVREEEFKIRQKDGTFKTEKRTVRETRHGVIINDFIDRIPDDFPLLALRRVHEVGRPLHAIHSLYLSKNVSEARQALCDFTAMDGHWSLADADGNVVYMGSVNLPKRAKHLGTFPVPGWTDDYEWEGLVQCPDMPYFENPPVGFVGTANNMVILPESFNYPIALEGDVPHRSGRIHKVLGAGGNGQPVVDQLQALQLDSVDLGWSELKVLYTEALQPFADGDDPLLAEAAKTLIAWDGTVRPDEPAATIFQTLNSYVFREAVQDEFSRPTLKFVMHYFNTEPLLFDVLAHPSNPAWDDRRTEKREQAVEVVTAVYPRAIAALAEHYGPVVSEWTWSTAAPFVLKHAFGDVGALGGYLNRGPLPTAGAGNTVAKHQYHHANMYEFEVEDGPVMRVVVDLNDLSASTMSLPGGQSGRPGSEHYDDMLPLFQAGEGAPLTLDFDQVDDNAVGKLVMTPAKM